MLTYTAYHARIYYHNDSVVEFRRSNHECLGLSKDQLDTECRGVADIVGSHIGSKPSTIAFLKYLPEVRPVEEELAMASAFGGQFGDGPGAAYFGNDD